MGIKRELRSPAFTTYVLLPAKSTSRHLNRHRQSNVAAADNKNMKALTMRSYLSPNKWRTQCRLKVKVRCRSPI